MWQAKVLSEWDRVAAIQAATNGKGFNPYRGRTGQHQLVHRPKGKLFG